MAVMDVMATRASKDIRVFMTHMAFLAIMVFMAIRHSCFGPGLRTLRPF